MKGSRVLGVIGIKVTQSWGGKLEIFGEVTYLRLPQESIYLIDNRRFSAKDVELIYDESEAHLIKNQNE